MGLTVLGQDWPRGISARILRIILTVVNLTTSYFVLFLETKVLVVQNAIQPL